MDVGIGLPNAVPEVDRAGTVDWARRAEEAGFPSLGTIGRIAFPNYEELTSLAAAAAVTERIRLTTDILLLPLHSNLALFAKQAATLDSIAGGGRLVLGLAPGAREDDFEVSGVHFRRRGKIFERQLQELTKIWAGDEVGPPLLSGDRPKLLIGGYTEIAHRRAAKYADGWTLGGGTPEAMAEGVAGVEKAWKEEGRDGSPYKMALFYWALGDDAEEHARKDLEAYYRYMGEEAMNSIVASAATDADTIKSYLAAFEQAGADEVMCFPTNPDPDQVELLADVVL
jgi:alkanesulfonate monooxygenase SsuD/methylene tetrahydromethanopterin reductase-like flavin-dependent oxidoreductase (luciferase family)